MPLNGQIRLRPTVSQLVLQGSSAWFESQLGSSDNTMEFPKAVKKSTDCHHIKRPKNCFMVWATEERRRINQQFPGVNNAEISRQLGEKWRTMTAEERQPYKDEADRLARLHMLEHPDYKYRPQKKPKRASTKPAPKGNRSRSNRSKGKNSRGQSAAAAEPMISSIQAMLQTPPEERPFRVANDMTVGKETVVGAAAAEANRSFMIDQQNNASSLPSLAAGNIAGKNVAMKMEFAERLTPPPCTQDMADGQASSSSTFRMDPACSLCEAALITSPEEPRADTPPDSVILPVVPFESVFQIDDFDFDHVGFLHLPNEPPENLFDTSPGVTGQNLPLAPNLPG